jgi:hypothetical protein
VTNGIFIRTYPARRAQIVPSSYSASWNGYFLVCFVPVWLVLFFIVLLSIGLRQQWVFMGLFVSVLSVLAALSLLRKLRLEINMDGITYAGLFRQQRFVSFHEISTVVFLDHRNVRSEAQPRRNPLSWTAIITPDVETNKPVLKIPLSLFPVAAYQEMERLLRPEVWESGI